MTLAQSTRYVLYQPVVLTDEYIITFPIFSTDDVTVFIDGVETALYSITATFVGGRATNAVLTLNTAVTNVDVEIYGTRAPRRENQYLGNSPSLADNLQNDVDAVTAVQQEQSRDFDTSLRVSPRSPVASPLAVDAATRAGRAIAFSGDGLGLVAGPTALEIANAQGYAVEAQAAAAAAVSAFDDFDDRYLGAKASDPVTDNDGDPLTDGDLYWNTVSSEMRVYSAGSWFSVSAGALLRANNLSDLVNPEAARTNLGLAIGSQVQAFNQKLASLAGLSLQAGDLLQATGANTLARIPKGSPFQVLRRNAADTGYEWVNPGTWMPVQSVTLSGQTAVDFDLDHSSYSRFRLRYLPVRLSVDTESVSVLISSNGGTSFHETNYRGVYRAATTSGFTASIARALNIGNASSFEFGVYGTVELINFGSASMQSVARGDYVLSRHTDGYPYTEDSAGVYETAEINDAVRVIPGSGNLASGELILEGIV